MNFAKHKYESLVLDHYELCKSSADRFVEILQSIQNDIDEIKKYNLFPLDFSDEFYTILSGKNETDFEGNKLKVCKELYLYLAKLMFSFQWANVDKMSSYRKALELGRTEFPYEQANEWCREYIGDQKFSNSTFFFSINSNKLYISTESDFNEYKLKLREEQFDMRTAFPTEIALSKDLTDSISNLVMKKYKMYMDYIEKNYSIIKHAFPSYNKQIRIYISLTYKNHYEYLMNMYDSYSYSIQIYPNDVGFLYRFANVEAIEEKISYGLYSGFSYPDYHEIDNLFDVSSIHHELNRLFVRYASSKDIKDYLLYILRGQLKRVSIISDNEIEIDKQKCLLFFNGTPTIKELEKQLNDINLGKCSCLAFRSSPDKSIIELLKCSNMPYINVSSLAASLINNQNGEMTHWFIKERLDHIQIDDSYKDVPKGDSLIKRLKECPKGRDGWSQYEKIGEEIFNYLFEDSFRNYKYNIQSTTEDGIFRRDMIVNNTFKDSSSFWKLVKTDYKSNLIVIDFKNYQSPLNHDQFFNPSKYMNDLTGYFVIIMSRHGLDNSAEKEQQRLMTEKKLMVCLSDENIIDFINQKTNGQNPLDSLENMYYELCRKK